MVTDGSLQTPDLVILGLAIKAIVSAVRRGRQRRPQAADHAQLAE
jgi:hypothetical protein